MKRTIIFVLAVVFIGTQLFAGGNRATVSSAAPLNVLMWTRDIADFARMDYYRQLETQTGISINLTTVDGNDWGTRTNLMFASGDYADVILRGNIDVEMYGVDQKILVPIEDYVDRYMPNYKALLSRDPSLINYMRASDGHNYYTAWLVPQNINVEAHLFINKTWLDNLRLPVPTTFAQFESTLRAFKTNYPNAYPFSGTWGGYESVLQFLSFWGIPFGGASWLHITDDNQVVSQLQHSNLRAAMETLSRWYSEGLIDMETVTQDGNAHNAKINAGQLGTLWRWRMLAMLTPDEIVEQYVGIMPVAAIPGVTPQVHRYLELPSRGAYITTACRDVERASRWIDAQYTFNNMNNGYYGPYKEVVQSGSVMRYGWQLASNGKVDFFQADLESIPNQSAIHFFSGPEYFEKFNMPVQRIEKTTYCEMYTNAGMVVRNSSTILTNLITMSIADMNQRDLLSAQIDTFAREALTNFITRGVTDASWNTFNATLQNLRINDYIRLYQTAYDRYRAAQR
jgi:putative aldouronate transport system substrate-binding protein